MCLLGGFGLLDLLLEANVVGILTLSGVGFFVGLFDLCKFCLILHFAYGDISSETWGNKVPLVFKFDDFNRICPACPLVFAIKLCCPCLAFFAQFAQAFLF